MQHNYFITFDSGQQHHKWQDLLFFILRPFRSKSKRHQINMDIRLIFFNQEFQYSTHCTHQLQILLLAYICLEQKQKNKKKHKVLPSHKNALYENKEMRYDWLPKKQLPPKFKKRG